MDELHRNGHPVIPRTGYIVEFNALWYNALRFVAEISREGGNADYAELLDSLAAKAAESFIETFRNEYGYLFDYVDGNMMDWSVRPNIYLQLLLIILRLTRLRRKKYWI